MHSSDLQLEWKKKLKCNKPFVFIVHVQNEIRGDLKSNSAFPLFFKVKNFIEKSSNQAINFFHLPFPQGQQWQCSDQSETLLWRLSFLSPTFHHPWQTPGPGQDILPGSPPRTPVHWRHLSRQSQLSHYTIYNQWSVIIDQWDHSRPGLHCQSPVCGGLQFCTKHHLDQILPGVRLYFHSDHIYKHPFLKDKWIEI